MDKFKIPPKRLEELDEVFDDGWAFDLYPESRPRFLAIRMVGEGYSTREVSIEVGCSPRTVANWVKKFIEEGMGAIYLMGPKQGGYLSHITELIEEQVIKDLKKLPSEFGLTYNTWSGNAFKLYLKKSYDIELGVRQCQNILHRLQKTGAVR